MRLPSALFAFAAMAAPALAQHPAPGTGMHGYLPDRLAMRSAFMVEGQGIAQGRNLHLVDMRQIAPTLAGLLNLHLPEARLPSLPVQP